MSLLDQAVGWSHIVSVWPVEPFYFYLFGNGKLPEEALTAGLIHVHTGLHKETTTKIKGILKQTINQPDY